MTPLFRPILLLAISFALGGCARTYWVHQTKASQEFYADSTDCMQMARANAPQPAFIPAPTVQVGNKPPSVADSFQEGQRQSQNQRTAENAERERNAMYDHCLRGRGWYTVQK